MANITPKSRQVACFNEFAQRYSVLCVACYHLYRPLAKFQPILRKKKIKKKKTKTNLAWVFYVLAPGACEKGPMVYNPHKKRPENLTIWRRNYKGSTTISVSYLKALSVSPGGVKPTTIHIKRSPENEQFSRLWMMNCKYSVCSGELNMITYYYFVWHIM